MAALFDKKDDLKARGYKWDPIGKVWSMIVVPDLDEEEEYRLLYGPDRGQLRQYDVLSDELAFLEDLYGGSDRAKCTSLNRARNSNSKPNKRVNLIWNESMRGNGFCRGVLTGDVESARYCPLQGHPCVPEK